MNSGLTAGSAPSYPLVLDAEETTAIVPIDCQMFIVSGTDGQLVQVEAIGLSRSATNEWLRNNPSMRVTDHAGGLDFIAANANRG